MTNPCEYTPAGIKVLGNVDLNTLLSAVISGGVRILSVNCTETSFEDYYLSLIGGGKG